MQTLSLIANDEAYENGLFPKKPAMKPGSAFVLAGGKRPPVVVDDNLPTRDIRSGGFNRVVEILTNPCSIDLRMEAMSKDAPYQFVVNAKVSVQIKNPLAFYAARIADVQAALTPMVYTVVRRAAKQFSIRDFSRLDDALIAALPQSAVYDESTGMQYRVIDVETHPEESAMRKHVQSLSDQQLQTQGAAELQGIGMEAAILGDVATGKITMEAALTKIKEHNRGFRREGIEDMQVMVDFISRMRETGHYSDSQAAKLVQKFLSDENKKLALPESAQENAGKSDGAGTPAADGDGDGDGGGDDDDVINSLYHG